ncbi:DUF5684 domain-containing protein [Amycolatopsis tucumanensis]|uniref:Signal peptidase I n=1 Tax=Amycolatopsis tucumanensis TaxID=401106 RepID=A0ABP7HAP3_9PSEU|nr:DUF5684 domain-containing protein [Amycolatopsis tucumanensis]MCF6425528.1 DUF5684 domain-containing protein [Amycolatopsis tucumanensis]
MNSYDTGGLSIGAAIGVSLGSLAFAVLMVAAIWRVFSKAGQPGWAAIVPIYNTIVLLRVAGRPWWWILLMLIPLVNVVLLFIVYIDLARSFGRGTGFGVLMVFFPFIFLPILGFGSARYLGPAGGQPHPGGPQPGGPRGPQAYPGQPYPGQQSPGQQYPGAAGPYPGQQQYPGQPHPGQQYSGPQHPGQQHSGQQYPGQQHPGQPYPGPQYPGQQPPR